jgi:hypothetical protein
MRAFVLIVSGGFGCAALGGGFGWLVGTLSPELVALLAQPSAVAEPQRLGAALGLVSGLLLGSVAMAFGLLVDAFRLLATRGRAARELPPDQPGRQTPPVRDICHLDDKLVPDEFDSPNQPRSGIDDHGDPFIG